LHTIKNEVITPPEQIFKDKKLFEDIEWFIHERLSIWKKKTADSPLPYTTDPILSKYRFCNIFREFDRQTIEFHTLLNPVKNDFPLWLLNMFYCRTVARTQTIYDVGLLSFNKKENEIVYKKLIEHSRPKFGTPYVFPISVLTKSKTPTRELFITQYLPTIMNDVADEIKKWDKVSVYDGVQKIIPIFVYNLYFLWTEVLIDVAYQFPEYINLFDRFPIGPGSLPTMKKIDSKKDPTTLVKELSTININTDITYEGVSLRLSAENWECIGCEYRKYTNLKAGNGRKRIFNKNDEN
jgi:hypothetical protein